MKKIKGVFVRHGISVANIEGKIAGNTDVELAKEGRQELLSLKNMINYPNTDLYFSSSLKRAVSTFDVLYNSKEVKYIDKFKEINLGELEGEFFVDVDLIDFFPNGMRGILNFLLKIRLAFLIG